MKKKIKKGFQNQQNSYEHHMKKKLVGWFLKKTEQIKLQKQQGKLKKFQENMRKNFNKNTRFMCERQNEDNIKKKNILSQLLFNFVGASTQRESFLEGAGGRKKLKDCVKGSMKKGMNDVCFVDNDDDVGGCR